MEAVLSKPTISRADACTAAAHLRFSAEACERVAQRGDQNGQPYDAWSLAYFDTQARAYRAAAQMLLESIDDPAQ